jgi:hypothetical protein
MTSWTRSTVRTPCPSLPHPKVLIGRQPSAWQFGQRYRLASCWRAARGKRLKAWPCRPARIQMFGPGESLSVSLGASSEGLDPFAVLIIPWVMAFQTAAGLRRGLQRRSQPFPDADGG